MNVTEPLGVSQVRVDGTYGLEARKAAEDKEAKARATAGAASGAANGSAEVVASQERLIASAAAVEEVNIRAVEEAKALLKAGKLDTPEAAERAAKAILDLGL